jgi:hypothetical protein
MLRVISSSETSVVTRDTASHPRRWHSSRLLVLSVYLSSAKTFGPIYQWHWSVVEQRLTLLCLFNDSFLLHRSYTVWYFIHSKFMLFLYVTS